MQSNAAPVKPQPAPGLDIDAVVRDDLTILECPRSPVTMDDLDRMIFDPDLLPQGTETQPLGHRRYRLLAPGMSKPVRVTTDPAYYEEHPEREGCGLPVVHCSSPPSSCQPRIGCQVETSRTFSSYNSS